MHPMLHKVVASHPIDEWSSLIYTMTVSYESANDEYEVIVGEARDLVEGWRKDFLKFFQELNRW